MSDKPFVYSGANGVQRVMHPMDHDSFVVETVYDLDPILDSVKRDQENVRPGSTNKLLARVPMTVYEQALREDWDDADWKKWLNDHQNEPFRVWKGRV
jgi:hypothetical protein